MRFGNCVHCTFTFTFFALCFLRVFFFLHMFRLNMKSVTTKDTCFLGFFGGSSLCPLQERQLTYPKPYQESRIYNGVSNKVCLYEHLPLCLYTCIQMYVFVLALCQRSTFKLSIAVLNSEFTFFLTSWYTKTKEPS